MHFNICRATQIKLVLLAVLLLSACSTPVPTVVMQPDSPVAVPDAEPVSMLPVHWQALTLAELQKLVAKLEETHQNTVLLALDTPNYNNLSINLAELDRYIKEQKAILTMLKTIIAERAAAAQPPGAKAHP